MIRDSTITPGAAHGAAAAARRGTAVVAWIARDGSMRARVRARGAGDFGHTQQLAGANAAGVAAAVDPQGRVAVVWAAADRRVCVALRDGRRFGRPKVLGRHDGRAEIAAAYSGRRLHVVWATQDGGEESTRPQVVHAASGERSFTRDRVVHTSSRPGDLSRAGGLRVVVLRGGVAAAWTSPTRSASSVHVAIARGSAFGPVRRLDADGVLDDLAVTTRGELVATWTRAAPALPPNGDGSTLRVMAAVRPLGGSFGAPEAVSDAGGSGSAVATGAERPTVAWTTTSGRLEVSERR